MIDLYKQVITIATICAKAVGYAVAFHGSGVRDLDLVVIPWVEQPLYSPEECVNYIISGLQIEFKDSYPDQDFSDKPHGRKARIFWIRSIYPIDISVMPIKEEADARPTS